jgi:hypothetical protein
MPNIAAAQPERLVTFRWAGPFSYRSIVDDAPPAATEDEHALGSLWSERTGYGIYQVYGAHPVYGSDALLYVGKAAEQTFAKRLRQEGWLTNRDRDRVMVYVGRLVGPSPSDEAWSQLIGDAERLLIYSVAPAGNSREVNTTAAFATHLRVFHVGNYRDIPAELSSLRWGLQQELASMPLATWPSG